MANDSKDLKQLRILFVSGRFPPFEYRAISQIAYDQAFVLAKRGIKVAVLTQNDNAENVIKYKEGIEVHYVGRPMYCVSSWELNPLIWSWSYLDYILSFSMLSKFDIVHVHDIDFALTMKYLSSFSKIPLIAHLHICFRKRFEIGGSFFNLELAHYYQFLMTKAADLVLTVSQSEKSHVEKFLHCSNKTFVVQNGIRIENYSMDFKKRHSFRAKYNLEKCSVILWGGRVGDWMKGPDIVGMAFSRIAEINDQARLVVAVVKNNPPENLDYLMNNLSDLARLRTIILSPSDKSDLLEIYSAVDIFIMPSRYEPFGIMALEAMACGIPSIVSPYVGLSDSIPEGNGLLKMQWGDPIIASKSLAAHIIELINNQPYRDVLSKRAIKEAFRFDLNKNVDQLIDIYCQLKKSIWGRSAHSWDQGKKAKS